MALLDDLAAAFGRQEGWGDPKTRATRNNNPGNLRDPGGRIYPQYPRDAGNFVIFPDAETGFNALKRDLSIKAARGESLRSALAQYAPASENDTGRYVANVAAWVGINPDVPLASIDPTVTAGRPTGPGANPWPLSSGGAVVAGLFERDEMLVAAAAFAAVGLVAALA